MRGRRRSVGHHQLQKEFTQQKSCHGTHRVWIYMYTIPRVFSSSLNFLTDSAHRTFSEASPPTSLLAREIVLAVVSASCWHLSLAAVAFSNWAVNSARLSSSSYNMVCNQFAQCHPSSMIISILLSLL